MPDTSLDVNALVLIALLFGLRHGLDADHLAMIDGLARLQARSGRLRLSRLCGVLFSAGHGLVLLIAAFVLQHFGGSVIPSWLEPLGAWISILFLFSVGITNLRNATDPGTLPTPTPITRWALQFPLLHTPVGGFIVGSMFAMSFDAMSIAAWFSLAGAVHGGPAVTIVLAGCFVTGMVVVDGVNGLVMAMLISRSERFVARARRMFALLVGCSALGMSLLILAKLSLPLVDHWAEGNEFAFSACIVLLLLMGFAIARGYNRTLLRAT